VLGGPAGDRLGNTGTHVIPSVADLPALIESEFLSKSQGWQGEETNQRSGPQALQAKKVLRAFDNILCSGFRTASSAEVPVSLVPQKPYPTTFTFLLLAGPAYHPPYPL
jgi:hypothetical protein